MSNLEVHHKEFCSHSGSDREENLITLCAACHSVIHLECERASHLRTFVGLKLPPSTPILAGGWGGFWLPPARLRGLGRVLPRVGTSERGYAQVL